MSPVEFRRIADQLVGEFRMLILRRREACYGGLQVTDAQAEEMARAAVNQLMTGYAVKELD